MQRRLADGELGDRVVGLIQIGVVADLRDAGDAPRPGPVRLLLGAHHYLRRGRVHQHRMALVHRCPLRIVEYLLRHGRATERSLESSIRGHAALQILGRDRLPLHVGIFRRVLAARIAAIQRLQFPFIAIVTKRYNRPLLRISLHEWRARWSE